MGEEPVTGNTPPPYSVITGICFKCGKKGHRSSGCDMETYRCFIPSCQSQCHNVEGHSAMTKLGITVKSDYKKIKTVKTVLPDKVTAAGVITPAGATTAADALALKKQKKLAKNKKK